MNLVLYKTGGTFQDLSLNPNQFFVQFFLGGMPMTDTHNYRGLVGFFSSSVLLQKWLSEAPFVLHFKIGRHIILFILPLYILNKPVVSYSSDFRYAF